MEGNVPTVLSMDIGIRASGHRKNDGSCSGEAILKVRVPGDPDRSERTRWHQLGMMTGIADRSWNSSMAARTAGLVARLDNACPDRRTGGARHPGCRHGALLRQDGRSPIQERTLMTRHCARNRDQSDMNSCATGRSCHED